MVENGLFLSLFISGRESAQLSGAAEQVSLREDTGVSPEEGKDYAYFKERQVRHPKVKVTLEILLILCTLFLNFHTASAVPVETPLPGSVTHSRGCCIFGSLDQKPANCSLCQIWPLPLFVNKVL